MRKFRGLTKDGKWVYGDYFSSGKGCYIIPAGAKFKMLHWVKNPLVEPKIIEPMIMVITEDSFVEVIPETVGQFIGKEDDNKKEIYKGDILQYADLLSDGWMIAKEKTIGMVNWIEHKCSFQPQEIRENHKGGHFIAFWDSIDEVEVIGDIHTTPELLEQK